MAYTPTQLEALNKAIAQGALYVQFGDKRVEYRSLDEMLKIKALMEADILGPSAATSGRRYGTFSKGLK